jgi:transposase InsO family protein
MAEDTRRFHGAKWAQFRFGVVGPLLSSPPAKGALQTRLKELSEKSWLPPREREPVKLGLSTIERWYYQARHEDDPIRVLRRKVRKDHGEQWSLSEPLKQAILSQYAAHKRFSYQLHYDNLRALAEKDSTLGKLPVYATVRRFMKSRGLFPQPRRGDPNLPGVQRAEHHLETREVRSWEAKAPNALWHLDFHSGSKQVLTAKGEYVTPYLLGVLDDYSRLCCHLQWYYSESAEDLIHALCQAFQKRGLPRALLTDNGGAMTADETEQGLSDCSVLHETTLPYSPYQNGKQEAFWGPVEGRLVAMLERVRDLSLSALNEATQAWVEMEYNRKVHSEIGASPLDRWVKGEDLGRACPSSDELRLRFTRLERRTQRLSDGTVSIEGIRFEIPARFRHLKRVAVRYARWDLARAWLWDEVRGVVLAPLFPLDKSKNADAQRRAVTPPAPSLPVTPDAPAIPPLMQSLLDRYKATGLPPAYLPKKEDDQ